MRTLHHGLDANRSVPTPCSLAGGAVGCAGGAVGRVSALVIATLGCGGRAAFLLGSVNVGGSGVVAGSGLASGGSGGGSAIDGAPVGVTDGGGAVVDGGVWTRGRAKIA